MPDEPAHPSIQRVLDAAARKGVTIEVTRFDESTHTAAEAATALGAELGQIVKSLVFVVPSEDGAEPLLCLVVGPEPGGPRPARRRGRRSPTSGGRPPGRPTT